MTSATHNMERILLQSRKIRELVLDSGICDSMADELVVISNDYSVSRNLGSHSFPFPYRKRDALDFIQRNREVGKEVFAIDFAMLFSGRLAGIIGLSDIDWIDRSGKVGYYVGRTFRKRGIATAALSAVADFSFSELKLHRLHTKAFTDNIASIKVLGNCGFVKEGLERQAFFQDGHYRDMIAFARLDSDPV